MTINLLTSSAVLLLTCTAFITYEIITLQRNMLQGYATRAQIIEGLINEKYMYREGRDLIPTAKAFQLMTLLRGLGVEDLTRPDLTGNWEFQLSEMEKGKLERETFMAEIARMAERIVKKAKEYDRDTIPGDYATAGGGLLGLRPSAFKRFSCVSPVWR